MFKLATKSVREEPEEMTVSSDEIRYIKYLHSCPKCKKTEDVIIFNVTKEIYECTGCNLRFRFIKNAG